ncbi:MAG: TerC family protein [Verrucomicrobia bacterium]|nr:TerC family protein [Verrucomicrobiota bacterium]
MLATAQISIWHWAGFIAVILIFLALDLGVFHRKAHVIKFKEALIWTFVWFTTAMLFAGLLVPWRGREESLEFVTGYIIELSLSMDNVFVIALIFSYFRVPLSYQHRVLFWGIIGALVMRGVMIGVGAVLIQRFHWMIYVFGAFLVLTGIKMLFAGDEGVHPEKNPVIRLVRRLFPVSSEFNGQKFFTVLNGQKMLTPLAIVLIMVETTDLIFAVDSIPAIFSVTTKPFIVFTSNVFAILGLRSLYFVLANAIGLFRYLKVGLSFVLVFVGVKMIIAPPPDVEVLSWFHFKIPTSVSLVVVAAIILLSIVISIVTAKRKPDSVA